MSESVGDDLHEKDIEKIRQRRLERDYNDPPRAGAAVLPGTLSDAMRKPAGRAAGNLEELGSAAAPFALQQAGQDEVARRVAYAVKSLGG